nr:putative late blight resistance protein homolog R1A-10 [Ipomoea batatas]
MDKDNMQTLSWVCPTHCRTGVYCRFPNIEKLKVFVFCNNTIILDNLEYLEHLERLSISVSLGCVVTLPKPSMFPSQLKKLRLNGTNLSERDLKNMKKKAGTTNSSEASKPKERHIVSWSQEEDDILRAY